jgi:predicted RNase H-like HicB family nuclease
MRLTGAKRPVQPLVSPPIFMYHPSTEDNIMKLTAVFQKVPQGYIAFVEELPGANTQGATLKKAQKNLDEAVQLVLEANRTLAEELLRGKQVIRKPFHLRAA